MTETAELSYFILDIAAASTFLVYLQHEMLISKRVRSWLITMPQSER
jgi:hypothetical protein